MVVSPGSRGLADVVEAFGPEVLDEKGELDRKRMGQIVFTTPERRRQLEAILHPRIRERYEQVLDALEKAGHEVMIYEVPLLFEKNLDQQDEFKGVILVTATTDTRMARVKARDSLTTDDVLARMRAQMPEQEKRQRADYIVHNDGDLDDLRREVEYLISRFLRVPPRSSEEELVEAELELDESEIDTLSPEEVEETPTAEMDLSAPESSEEVAAAAAAAQAQLEIEVVGEQLEATEPEGLVAELEVELAPAPVAATPTFTPPSGPTFSPPFIPTAPTPVTPMQVLVSAVVGRS
jgi:dephospho-CoA kinase